jgi:hypothetical protein
MTSSRTSPRRRALAGFLGFVFVAAGAQLGPLALSFVQWRHGGWAEVHARAHRPAGPLVTGYDWAQLGALLGGLALGGVLGATLWAILVVRCDLLPARDVRPARRIR